MNLRQLFEEVLSSHDQFITLRKMSKAADKYHYYRGSEKHYGEFDKKFFNIDLTLDRYEDLPDLTFALLVKNRPEDRKYWARVVIWQGVLPTKESGEAKEIWDFLEGKATFEEIIDYARQDDEDSKKLDEIFGLFDKNTIEEDFYDIQKVAAKTYRGMQHRNSNINAWIDKVSDEYSDRFKQYHNTLWDEWMERGGPKKGDKVEALVEPNTWKHAIVRAVKKVNGNIILKIQQDKDYVSRYGLPSHVDPDLETWIVPLNRCKPLFEKFNYGELDNKTNTSKFLNTYPDSTGYDLYSGLDDFDED